jgi:hypothetical protein
MLPDRIIRFDISFLRKASAIPFPRDEIPTVRADGGSARGRSAARNETHDR